MEPTRYADVLDGLRTGYDGRAGMRDARSKQRWKLDERAAFLARLQLEGCRTLLEIGAGTGHDSVFFASEGLDVVATDLSPEMVRHCRAKGLEAQVMDFLGLAFDEGSFDAVYALNCLLHVPNADLPLVLARIRAILRPGGLFYFGVYGGDGREGPVPEDDHVPPRFFSWRTDQEITGFARRFFEVVDFHVVEAGPWRFQSLTLRRPA